MNFNKTYILVLMVVLLSKIGFAAGTTSADFLLLPVNARAAGMGNSYAACVDDASAVIWNPARLTKISGFDINMYYDKYLLNMTQNNVNLCFNEGSVAFGVGINRLSYGNLQGYDIYGTSTGNFSAQDININLGLGIAINDYISIGGTGKYIRLQHGEYTTSSLAGDGALDISYKGTNLSFILKNLGTSIKFVNEGYPLPLEFKSGISSELFKGFIINGDFSVPIRGNKEDAEANFGIEYSFFDIICFRAGYIINNAFYSFAGGIGLKISYLSIDYAVLPMTYNMGLSHKLSISFHLGGDKESEVVETNEVLQEDNQRYQSDNYSDIKDSIADDSRQPVPKQKYCPECGAPIKSTQDLCSQCKEKRDKQESSTQQMKVPKKETVSSQTTESVSGKSTTESVEYKFCPECGLKLPGEAQFCGRCGYRFKQEKEVVRFCPECGEKLKKGALFCPECGAKIK